MTFRSPPRPTPQTALAESSTAALRRVDFVRNRRGLDISALMAVAVALAIQVVPSKSLLHWMATLSLMCAALFCAALRFRNARRGATDDTEQLVLGMALCFVALVVLAYVGPFSAGVVVLALLVFCHGFANTELKGLTVYASCASGYLALTIATLSGLVVPGKTPVATVTTTRGFILLSLLVQAVLFAVYLIARQNRQLLAHALANVIETQHQLRKNEVELVRVRADAKGHDGGVFGKLSGLQLGDYRLGEVIGRGGMGEVYRALNAETSEPVAVKVLAESMRDDPVQIERFFREAQVCAALASPHIVEIRDAAWSDDGRYPFLAMELLEGHDLGTHLRARGPLPLRDVVDLVQDVARALTCAHAIGVVHRDMKPENVFLTHDEEGPLWKVLDFGISKMRDSGGTLTKNGVIGTPNYMSPEQAQGGGVDARSDVFALGSIVYRVLTGRLAFDAQEPLAALLQVLNEQPIDPMDLCELPSDVELAVAIALSKDKTRRFTSAQSFADAFRLAARSALPGSLRQRGRELLAERPWSASDAVCTKSALELSGLTPPSPVALPFPVARPREAHPSTSAFPDFAELLAGGSPGSAQAPLPPRRSAAARSSQPSPFSVDADDLRPTTAPPAPRSSHTRSRRLPPRSGFALAPRGSFVEDDTLPLDDVLARARSSR
jgi:eukaryotic-like serine/threonine-protein kinase